MSLTVAGATAIAGGLAAAGSLGSTAISGGFRGSRAKQEWAMNKQASIQYKYQQMAAEEQMRRQKELWNMQNEYNTPAAQRARLEEAGLLGASLFNGQSPGQATVPDSPTPGGPNVSLPGSDVISPWANTAATVMDQLAKVAQIRNTESNTQLNEAATGTTAANQALLEAQTHFAGLKAVGQTLSNEASKIQNWLAETTKNFTVESARLAVDSSKQSLSRMVVDTQNAIRQGKLTDVQIEQANMGISLTTANIALVQAQTQLANAGVKLSEAEVANLNSLITYRIKQGLLLEDEHAMNAYRKGEMEASLYRTRSYTYGEYPEDQWLNTPFLQDLRAGSENARAGKDFVYKMTSAQSEILRKQNKWYNTRETFGLVNDVGSTVAQTVFTIYGLKGMGLIGKAPRRVGF